MEHGEREARTRESLADGGGGHGSDATSPPHRRENVAVTPRKTFHPTDQLLDARTPRYPATPLPRTTKAPKYDTLI